MAISAKTNLKSIKIKFDNGDEVKFYYNPEDSRFYSKLYLLEDNIQKAIDMIRDEQSKKPVDETDEVAIAKECLELFDKTDKIICDEVDKLFYGNASEKIFKYSSALSLYGDDEYYVTYILGEIFKDIESVLKKTTKNKISNKR